MRRSARRRGEPVPDAGFEPFMTWSPPLAPRIVVAGTLALTLIEGLWELVLAPLAVHAGGWLALKAVPLAWLLPGVARGQRRTRQYLALLLPFYAAEALVRAVVEPGRRAIVAATVCSIAVVVFAALLAWFRTETLRHREDRPLDDA